MTSITTTLSPVSTLPPLPPISTLFPYTTLFRSQVRAHEAIRAALATAAARLGASVSASAVELERPRDAAHGRSRDRKSTRLNSSHVAISYAVFCLKKKKQHMTTQAFSKLRRKSN